MRVALALVPVLLATSPALAQDRRRAGALFREGEALYAREEWAGALEKFEESYRTVPHVATRFNVAKSLEQLGRLAEADRAFADVESGDDEGLAASARAARARIASRIATVRVEAAPDVEVTIDGEPCPTPCERRVDPGEHEVLAGTGEDAIRETFTLAPGQDRTIRPGEAPPPEEEPSGEVDDEPPDTEPEPPSEGFATDRLLLWGGVAAAGVGLTLTTIFGLRASALEQDVEDARFSGPDPDDVDAGESAATIANVGIVVTLVGVGAAAAGLLLGLDAGDERDESALRLDPTPRGLVLSGALP